MSSISESAFWRILSSTDTYDPDRLSFDRELLRRFYLRKGYADFRVTSVVAELTPDREGFIVTFTLEEGERHKFGKIDITITFIDLEINSNRARLLVAVRARPNVNKGVAKVADGFTQIAHGVFNRLGVVPILVLSGLLPGLF